MREIVFRGKRISNGEWVHGGIVKSFHPNFPIESEIAFFTQRPNAYAICVNNKDYFVEQETIGQYTGLKDKDGIRIFEGDILLFGEKRLIVYFNGEAFQYQAREQKEITCTCTYSAKDRTTWAVWDNIDLGWIACESACTGRMTTKIIGNIYDTPELMKEKGEEP